MFALLIVAAMAAMAFAPFMDGPLWVSPIGAIGLYAALRQYRHRFTYVPHTAAPAMTTISASGYPLVSDGSIDVTGLPRHTVQR